MQELINILSDSKELIGSLVTVIMIVVNIVKSKKSNDGILKKIESNDLKQDERMNSIEGKQNQQAEKFDLMFKYITDKELSRKIKSKINCSIASLIKSYDVDNDELKTLFLAGGDALGYLIDDLILNDFFTMTETFDSDGFKLKAKFKLKELKVRIQSDKLEVDEKYLSDLKACVYNNMSKLISRLIDIKSGQYNGTSKQKFEEAFIKCAKNVITDSIELYNDYLTIKNLKHVG